MGYDISVSLETSHSIGEEGNDVKIFTYQIIREEEIQLYGFATEKERDAFLMLISVPGVGPRVALRILSGLTTEQLYQAIISEDIDIFTEVPGVGRKTGERIIVELKQKIEKLPVLPGKEEKIERDVLKGAVEALIVLGYKRKDAVDAVSRVIKEAGRAMSIEDVIREALKRT